MIALLDVLRILQIIIVVLGGIITYLGFVSYRKHGHRGMLFMSIGIHYSLLFPVSGDHQIQNEHQRADSDMEKKQVVHTFTEGGDDNSHDKSYYRKHDTGDECRRVNRAVGTLRHEETDYHRGDQELRQVEQVISDFLQPAVREPRFLRRDVKRLSVRGQIILHTCQV